MGYSSLVNHIQISPNRTSPRKNVIDTITIHCTAGQCSVESLGQWFLKTSPKPSSANYGIGKDGRIGLYVDENDRSWCSSSKENDNRAVTIEVSSDNFHPYAVSSQAYSSLIDLCTDICRRNGIPELKWRADKSLIGRVALQNMTVHRWFAAKACPGDYLYNRHTEIAHRVNQKLNPKPVEPINPIYDVEKEEEMDLETFKKYWYQMRKELQDNDSSKWSQEARVWAINSGLIIGGSNGVDNFMWEDVLTREQLIMILYRYSQLSGKA